MTQPYHFTPNELWTLGIAAYAAMVSTFVLGWDAYKWLSSGARLEVSAQAGMKMVGGFTEDENTYVLVTAYNVGDRPTTITNLGGMYFESWWRAYIKRRRPKEAFIVTSPSQAQRLPYRFDVGDQWMGMTIQSDDIVRKAREGYLFLIVYSSRGGRGHRVRLKIQAKEKQKEIRSGGTAMT
ncbi:MULTISPECIES: hypothetical protein [Ralstonia solanacearum species complex]|uniref:hypothetical protein n=1 Tax=Ralstonia solanacearum species complex TaxID=3116862 RepID=UPI000E58C492|nr:hypothetical protein [Ralstonia solanacearum]AXV76711.1 hypothetical protein CJO76_06785 [Ralstonia solanacearum]AXV90720.1 hypothetical protein CJO79_06775 [Ralstonia solanacearum]AXW18883.1 hypothetical protein CJO85_06815 [Ralstonia solanacearum]AXW61798.1 hypothetical protein CJO94_07355 [Ralstonia solanacearum]AXW75634.1 hypothetical protein CJO97_06770 [Ralstonia solanacearum]